MNNENKNQSSLTELEVCCSTEKSSNLNFVYNQNTNCNFFGTSSGLNYYNDESDDLNFF